MKKLEEAGVFLLGKCHLDKLLFREKATNEYVEMLHPRGRREEILLKLWGGRVVLLLGILVMAFLVWLSCHTAEPEDSLLSGGKYLTRQSEDSSVQMEVTGTDGGEVWKKTISVNVRQKKFTEEEKQELETMVRGYVEERLAGDNPSLQEVTKPLVFAAEVPGTEADLDWSWDEEYIKESGALVADRIPPGGIDTDVMLEAECRNWKKTFYFTVHLMPPVLSRKEQQIRDVKQAIRDSVKEQSSEAVVELPETVGSMKVTYGVREEEKNYLPVYFLLGIILLLPLIWREQQKKKLEGREEQMLLDHPGIVNKTMLLLSAGLTIRGAVERLGLEYERDLRNGGDVHYAYEEICIMMQEMRDGVSEGKAMEHFGRRCRLMPYLRFSSVITQNLKKGAGGVLDILEQEALEAMEQRKERVLRMGETAGTRLLFPMMLMLGLVIGIILVPAFMVM